MGNLANSKVLWGDFREREASNFAKGTSALCILVASLQNTNNKYGRINVRHKCPLDEVGSFQMCAIDLQ
jgi:hypothetical protein